MSHIMESTDTRPFNKPYKIHSVENIRFKSHKERLEVLEAVHFNPFRISHEDVIVDLLTDSGTNSINMEQQSKSFLGDESYAGARSYEILEKNVQLLTGFENILPFHQKRLCEQIVCEVLTKSGGMVVANTFTHTMEASLREMKSIPISLVTTEENAAPFSGNMDMGRFHSLLSEKNTGSIDFVVLNVPSKILGGMPVSLANIKAVTSFCKKNSILVFLETSMYVENSWMIKNFENGQSGRELISIAQDMFSCFDGCILSFSRDGMNLTGSVLACRDRNLISKFQPLLILRGGFVSYGGMSGRMIETCAAGIFEAFNEAYIDFRFEEMRRIGQIFKENGVPITEPIGTNTIFIDVDKIQKETSVSYSSYPGWSINCAAYVYGGVRGAEYGQLTGPGSSLPNNHPLVKKELIKLEIPRCTYSICHYVYVARVFGHLIANNHLISGMQLVEAPVGRFRYLKMKLKPLEPEKLNASTKLQT